VAEIPWVTVAQSVDALGLGRFPPEELRDAANDWCAKTCKKELDAEDAAALELRRRNAS
jgi:hypothetical protein